MAIYNTSSAYWPDDKSTCLPNTKIHGPGVFGIKLRISFESCFNTSFKGPDPKTSGERSTPARGRSNNYRESWDPKSPPEGSTVFQLPLALPPSHPHTRRSHHHQLCTPCRETPNPRSRQRSSCRANCLPVRDPTAPPAKPLNVRLPFNNAPYPRQRAQGRHSGMPPRRTPCQSELRSEATGSLVDTLSSFLQGPHA